MAAFYRLQVLFIILLLLSSSLFPLQAQSTQGGVPDATELQALHQLYDATAGGSWTQRAGWPTTSTGWQAATLADAAGWYGVSVSNGDVVDLQLPGNNLRGTLPISLGDLRALYRLSLQNNLLTGPIPATLGQLLGLQHFNLFNNQLTGSIPAEVGQLRSLLYLNLFANQLTGSIPASLGQLTSLRDLNLFNNRLTGTIPAELGQLRNLQYLNLNTNQLTGATLPALGQLGYLQHLRLHENQFSFRDLEPLFSGPGQTGRASLFQYAPQITPTQADTVACPSGQPVTLTRGLGGRHTQYQWQQQVEGAWQTVAGATDSVLQLAAAQVTAGVLYRTQATNSWVTGLTLTSRPLYLRTQGQGVVPDSVELRVLRHFYYKTGGDSWYNRTNWPNTPAAWQAATIAQAAGWVGLTVTDGDVTALRSNGNNQQGTLPQDLGDLRALTVLHVSNCRQLGGPVPNSIYQLTNLTYLRFVTTSLTGWVLPEIGRLTRLQHLAFYNSPFSGPLPHELGQLRELTWLQLDNAQFTGDIPKEICQLTKLNWMMLGSSYITGTIPPEMGNLRQLTVLSLEGKLHGTIPPALLQLPLLQELYLGNKQIVTPYDRLTTLPGPATVPNPAQLRLFITNNSLTFADLEPHFRGPGQYPYARFDYAPQQTPQGADTAFVVHGAVKTLERSLGGQHTHYQWQQQLANGSWEDIAGQTTATLQLPAMEARYERAYRTRATNDYVTNLTLYSKPVYVSELPYAPLPYNEPAPLPTTILATGVSSRASNAQDRVNYVRTYTPRVATTALDAASGATAAAREQAATTAAAAPTGSVLFERWTGVPGNAGLGGVPFTTAPASTSQLSALENAGGLGNTYGSRLRGYVIAPQTGSYTFLLAGDDQAQLYLSPDESPLRAGLIASVPSSTTARQWNPVKFASQQSDPVTLVAGRRYYVEVLHQQGGGGDHVAVAWRRPDGVLQGPIPGTQLAPAPASAAPMPANLARNPSFEADGAASQTPQGWRTRVAPGTIEAADYTENYPTAYSGTYHGSHYRPEAYDVYTYQTLTGLTPGRYALRAFVRTSGGQTKTGLRASNYGGPVREASPTVPLSGDQGRWTRLELLDVLVTGDQCEIGFFSQASGGQALYFDDVSFTRQDAPAPVAVAGLRNGGFEVDEATQTPTGWLTQVSSGTDQSADYTDSYPTAHGGRYHGSHYRPSAYEVSTYQLVTGLPNGRYVARAWLRAEDAQTQGVLRVQSYGGALRQVGLPTGTGVGSWVQVELADIAVTNGQCEVSIYTKSPVAKGFYFDDVELAQTADAQGTPTAQTVASTWSKEQLQVQTQYLDGLGRPVQTVQHQQSFTGRDVVQPVAYDALGREPRQYLPYAATSTPDAVGYRPNALYEQDQFYRQPQQPSIAPTGVAFAQTRFEASPLNRVLAQASPGEAWQLDVLGTRAVSFNERPNALALGDSVQRLAPGYGTEFEDLTPQGAYADGELWVNETQDEARHWARTYTDKQGQVVLKQVALQEGNVPGAWLNTYYVYDDFSRLRAVIPPKAVQLLRQKSWQVTGAGLERLLFRYRYDGRGRLIEKKVPDQDGYAYTVYDPLDRPILTQDVQQRASQQWLATKYDALGRVVYTALVTRSGQSREQLQTAADAAGKVFEQPQATALVVGGTSQQPVYYSNLAFPAVTGSDQLLSVSYYDSYDFDQNGTADLAYETNQATATQLGGAVPAVDLRVTGQPTRSLVRVLGVAETQTGAWLTSTSFYDEKLRPIQVVSTNARGGTDVTSTRYDFIGQALSSYTRHQVPSQPAIAVQQQTSYDHAGRVLQTEQTLAGGTRQVLAQHTYNELGQLQQKVLGPQLQTVDYRYNVRGWLTHVNDPDNPDPTDLWNLQLHYEQGFNENQYNGNIAGQTWRSRADGIERAYGYRYDALNRLLQGDFIARTPTGPTTTAQPWSLERSNYRLWATSYDAAGNLQTLRRRGLVAAGTSKQPAQYAETDNLRYNYASPTPSEPISNRLQRVDDLAPAATAFGAKLPQRPDFSDGPTTGATTPDYSYDAAGSLLSDKNKQITSITYNYLHLPTRLEWADGNALEYRYTAAGQKVTKLAYTAGKPQPVRTDYVGAWQYEQDTLRWLSNSEGRMLRLYSRDAAGQVTTKTSYEYTLKDHLGNLRVAFRPGERKTYWATMNFDPDQAELRRDQQQFDSASVSPPIRVLTQQFARTGNGVARLLAGGLRPTPLGPLKQLPVAQGDTVTVTAYGMYQTPVRNTNWAFSLASFVASLVQQQPAAPAPTTDAGGTRRVRVLPLLSVGLGLIPAVQQLAGGVPKAYLRVLVYNADSTLAEHQPVLQQLTTAANGNYQQLTTRVMIPRQGYIQAFVANESEEEVYFDDISVEHRQGLIVQETEYDPYGLELAGMSRAGMPENKYTFNGKERQDEFGLRWHDHGWRFYDPSLGRWVVSDPDAEEGDQESWGTYQFGLDNAVRYNDLDGRVAGPGTGVLADPSTLRGAGIIVLELLAAATAAPELIIGAGLAYVISQNPNGGGMNKPHYVVSYEPFYTSQAQYDKAHPTTNRQYGRAQGTQRGTSSSTSGTGTGGGKRPEKKEKGYKPGNVPHDERDPQRAYPKRNIDKRYAENDSRCEYCSEKTPRGKYRGDHKVPHGKGGRTDENNLAGTCETCNAQKSDKTIGPGPGQYQPPKPLIKSE